jgi:hypothetical protein
MNERDTIACGCVVFSDAVTGASSLALVAVTTMSEPSAISVLGAGSARCSAATAGAVSAAAAVAQNEAASANALTPSRRVCASVRDALWISHDSFVASSRQFRD